MNKTCFVLVALFGTSCLGGCDSNLSSSLSTSAASSTPIHTPPAAVCGEGSKPESDIQGRVPQADHESGRVLAGYSCNAEMIGSYTIPTPRGTVGGFKVHRYIDAKGNECAYYDTTTLFPSNVLSQEVGVNVLDMSNPSKPVLTERLVTPAMMSPHESLVLSKQRGVLAAGLGNAGTLPGILDLYDISEDCRHPILKSSTPVATLGHESGMSPDGLTYYSSTFYSATVTAVDISDLAVPVPITIIPVIAHGLSVSDDGNRIYIGHNGNIRGRAITLGDPSNGLTIVDTTQIQSRTSNPQTPVLSTLTWSPVSTPQNAIPITVNGRPYVIEIDEFGAGLEVGAARIIDISDETKPQVISNLRLAVHNPENFERISGDPSASSPIGGYSAHYCNVPQRDDPGIVACSMILSGLRVFDIRDVHNPREIAYFNAPVNPGIITGDAPGTNSAMSAPAFAPERKEIWYSDSNVGLFVIRLTNGVW